MATQEESIKVVFIAGPFRGESAWAIEQNIRRAEQISLEVWRLGMVAVCPHTNTRFFQGALPDDIWLKGYLELVKRCDAVLVVAGWQTSSGAREEVEQARIAGIPVVESMGELQQLFRDSPYGSSGIEEVMHHEDTH